VAASALTDLRRKLTDKLAEANRATYPYDYRKAEQRAATAPSSELSYHANVANSLAKTVYRSHGVNGDIDDAPEVCKPNGEVCVMHTRYCLRRELGHCLLSPAGREWKEPLRLTAPGIEFTLQFDCRNCRMKVMMYHQSR
jgi:putative protease